MLRVTQLSGFGNQAAAIAGPHTVSIDLDGTERLATSGYQQVNIGDPFSISFWMRYNRGSSGQQLFALEEASGDANRIEIYQGAGGGSASIQLRLFNTLGDIRQDVIWNNILFGSNWTHIMLTTSGAPNGSLLYKNGVLETVDDYPWNEFVSASSLTNRRLRMPWSVDSRVHSIGTWDLVLPANDVVAIYNGGDGTNFDLKKDQGDYNFSDRLTHWWKFGQNRGNIGKDFAASLDLDELIDVTTADIVQDSPL